MPGCQDVKVEDIQTESHQNEGEIVPGTFVFSQRVHGDLSMSIAPGRTEYTLNYFRHSN